MSVPVTIIAPKFLREASAISLRSRAFSCILTSSLTLRASLSEEVTSTEEASSSCSAWLKRSEATNSGGAVLSAIIRTSLGPAIISISTSPKTIRLAVAT
ncbi:hypothetical protein BMS3Bbin07_00417 [bacterium BMS3Bbin07]|nr:hypothetical protein BMS3Bbin07_00417 [bacterium BMS3Bbin07]